MMNKDNNLNVPVVSQTSSAGNKSCTYKCMNVCLFAQTNLYPDAWVLPINTKHAAVSTYAMFTGVHSQMPQDVC